LKQKIKEQLKEVAKEIRFAKFLRKPKNHTMITEEQEEKFSGIISRPWRLDSIRWDYRHKHIAYCMFFNKTPYERIELHCKEAPSFNTIDKYQDDWKGQIDEPAEALRDCA
jgi:hypothetical protein